jgi:hypothetical protein
MFDMTRRALGLALLFLTFASGSVTLLPAAGAAAGPYTTWAMTSDPGDYILGGERRSYDASSDIRLDGTNTYIFGGVDGFFLSIVPADGDTLAAGRTYDGAISTAWRQPSEPGISFDGNGSGCNSPNTHGSFAIQELSFDLFGDLESLRLSFVHHCYGSKAASYSSIAWHASNPAVPLPPDVTLNVNAPNHLRYGQKVTADVQLSYGAPNSQVSVYARTNGGPERLVAAGSVDGSGHFAVSTAVTEETTFVARYKGGGTVPDREAEQSLKVAAKLRSDFFNKAPKRGRFRLYQYRRDAIVGSLMLPNHRGDCLTFRLQLRLRGAWGYPTVTRCLKLNGHSAVGVRVPGDPRAVGIPIRIRSEWKGDDRNTAAKGKWLYLKFVH